MNNGLEDKFIIKDNKKLRFGYTTGSCAAAAAKVAVLLLLTGEKATEVSLTTPKGLTLFLEPVDLKAEDGIASCGIVKDAGDDPDVTDGLTIYAHVKKADGFKVDGGEGVGRITLPGLKNPVGDAAINPVPRQMIIDSVKEVCKQAGYEGGIEITISVPGGEEVAARTFNPRLGIVGGISILGTSGIVEPMSEQALIDAIEVELKQRFAAGDEYIVCAPGNYGMEYLDDNFPFDPERAVKCSNFIGQTIDMAVNIGFKGILFVGHIGKFVKLAGGVMNTHSREADVRMDVLAACALEADADAYVCRKILHAATTDEGLRILKEADILEDTMDVMSDRIDFYLENRHKGSLITGAVVFSNVYGELARTSAVEELIEIMIKGNK